MFFDSFIVVFKALLQIFIIGIVAAILLRKKLLKEEHIKSLADVIINIFLPALIFSKVVKIFNPHDKYFKEVLSRRENAKDFLRQYLPENIIKLIDKKEKISLRVVITHFSVFYKNN